jgi:hypothetical protein
MRKIGPILCVAAMIVSSSPGLFAATGKPIVNYDITARLVPEEKKVEGREVLIWLNDSDVPVSELQFHLYLNAFKNNLSTFMKESGGSHRGFKMDEENWGSITLNKFQIQDGADLLAATSFLQPDDGNPDDQTVLRVGLPAPVKPHESITLAMEFTSKLPKVFARSGFVGDFFMIGQWFPKIGVFQNKAWNCHQYHSTSEFYADFGVYKVAITVPEKYVVGATGKRILDQKNADGTRTVTHYQEDVHDFAWAACPDFVEFKETYKLDEPRVETEMILLVHRAHLRQKDRYAGALRNGLEFYSKSYGAYPYPTITLVDPAPGAMAAGGMEYPTLFTAETMSWLPLGVRLPEMVTIHEFGHNYWYGMVGSNEFEEAWLDEGINSYSEIKAMDRYYGAGRSMIDFGSWAIGDETFNRTSVIGSGRFDPIVKKSWDFIGRSSYALNVYSKAALMLLTLERWLGEDVMAGIMRTYFERWKFRHPTTKDFVRVAEEVSGKDLSWFFDQVLYSPDKLDYGISDLRAEEVPEPEGLFDGRKTESAKNVRDKAAGAKTAPKKFRNVVVAARFGEWVFPQEVLIEFDNGEKVRETWDGKDRWKRFVYVKDVKVRSAEVDPGHKLALDVNYANNSRVLEPRKPVVMKIAAGFMEWFQGFLTLISF